MCNYSNVSEQNELVCDFHSYLSFRRNVIFDKNAQSLSTASSGSEQWEKLKQSKQSLCDYS